MSISRQIAAVDAALLAWTIFAKSAVAASITGTLTETALATVTIPAGLIGPNGQLKVTAFWTVTNSVNNKTLRGRLGGIAGSTCFAVTATTMVLGLKSETNIANRNSVSSQYTATTCARGTDGLVTTTSSATAVNTGVSQDLVLSAQLANTGETITLEGYIVEYLA